MYASGLRSNNHWSLSSSWELQPHIETVRSELPTHTKTWLLQMMGIDRGKRFFHPLGSLKKGYTRFNSLISTSDTAIPNREERISNSIGRT